MTNCNSSAQPACCATPEQVALILFDKVVEAEKGLSGATAQVSLDRKRILDTYAECIEAVRGQRHVDVDAETPPDVVDGGSF